MECLDDHRESREVVVLPWVENVVASCLHHFQKCFSSSKFCHLFAPASVKYSVLLDGPGERSSRASLQTRRGVPFFAEQIKSKRRDSESHGLLHHLSGSSCRIIPSYLMRK
ncbi:hypothetical protein MRX96_049496 [Rhipicephalus microplus]